ncbi:unnamed protein product [Porites lobata]|uniref:MATH domain-containing protein n=1 Tax=Porites lobata TaxID=104759 RepID=A0ABN8MQ18_9CNID|nr:unnamed protein product [Porites lobata]
MLDTVNEQNMERERKKKRKRSECKDNMNEQGMRKKKKKDKTSNTKNVQGPRKMKKKKEKKRIGNLDIEDNKLDKDKMNEQDIRKKKKKKEKKTSNLDIEENKQEKAHENLHETDPRFEVRLTNDWRELQLHLSECRQRQRECNIVGCKFWGSSRSLAEHNKDEAERHVSLLLIENRKLQEALLGAKKDALKTRTVESITSFYWTVNSFRQRTRVIMAATDDAPLISPEFQWDTRDWRMFLYIQATECKLYLQLMHAMSPTRIAIRFLICGDDDKIFTLEDEVMAEGQMLGTTVPFSLLEKKVEETGGFLHVKIFIEKINRTF